MNFSKLLAVAGGIIFIVILYFILFYALKIMYKDIKTGGKRRKPSGKSNKNKNPVRKKHGLEVMLSGNNIPLKQGSIIPISGDVTIGRKEDNSVALPDQHVSGHHAILTIQNDVLYIEDLNSTNGTFINDKKINGKVKLFSRDEVRIGTTKFRVL